MSATNDDLDKKLRALEDRKSKIDAARNARANPPQPQSVIPWQKLIEVCQYSIDQIAREGYNDEDTAHYIYEAALNAIYGPTIFK